MPRRPRPRSFEIERLRRELLAAGLTREPTFPPGHEPRGLDLDDTDLRELEGDPSPRHSPLSHPE